VSARSSAGSPARQEKRTGSWAVRASSISAGRRAGRFEKPVPIFTRRHRTHLIRALDSGQLPPWLTAISTKLNRASSVFPWLGDEHRLRRGRDQRVVMTMFRLVMWDAVSSACLARYSWRTSAWSIPPAGFSLPLKLLRPRRDNFGAEARATCSLAAGRHVRSPFTTPPRRAPLLRWPGGPATTYTHDVILAGGHRCGCASSHHRHGCGHKYGAPIDHER